MNKKVIISVSIGLIALIMIAVIAGIQIRNNMISGSMGIGNAALSQGKYEEAIVAYNQVLKIDSKNTKVRLNLSKAYIGAKQFDEAKQTLLDAIEIDGKNKETYNKLLENLLVNPPKASLESGKYDEEKIIEIAQINEGDKNFYTLDGIIPTEKSTLYGGPINLKEGKTVLRIITINKLGISGLESKYEYEVIVSTEKKFMELLSEGKVEGLSFSIGNNITDVIKTMGEPTWQGYFLGGIWYTYSEVSFATAQADGKITAISFNKGTSLYGIKVGDSIEKVKSVLGANPSIIRTDVAYDEMANTGDKTTMTYISGKYELVFHCDSIKTTGAIIEGIKE